MGCINSSDEKTGPSWKRLEESAVTKRQELCAQAMSEILGGATHHGNLPRMGLCLSGGGWRSMTSATAMFDALSIPCPNTEKRVKPLDCFTHAFGLSGGSWMLFNTLAGASQKGGGYNPFHATADNPWLYGSNHFFNPGKHKYAGLVRMVNKEVVDEACCRGDFQKSVGYLSSRIGADSTIAAVLSSKHLGPTLVERWASFISTDLLGWMDTRVQDTDDVRRRVGAAQSAAANKMKVVSNFLSSVTDSKAKKAVRAAEQQEELEQEWKLRSSLPSQRAQFGHMKEPINNGSLPFIVCAAICNKAGATQDEIEAQQEMNEQMKLEANAISSGDAAAAAAAAAIGGGGRSGSYTTASPSPPPTPVREEEALNNNVINANKMRSPLDCFRKPQLNHHHHKRLYDWVEFTPFFTRLSIKGSSTKYGGGPRCYPTAEEVQGRFTTASSNNEPPPQPLYVHHLMAVCGSAFACDLSSALPTSVQARLTKNHELNANPLIGRGTTTISSANPDSGRPIGECRDAGIDFNVPLPPMLSEAGREFDIIVVMDAGAGSVNAHELQRCIELGYVEAPRNVHPHQQYAKGRFVRVFRHPRGPTIIYFIGLVDRGTHCIISSERLVLFDAARLRERVTRQLVPTMIAEMTRFKNRQERRVANQVNNTSIFGVNSSSSPPGQDDDPSLLFADLEEEMLNNGDGDEDDNLPSNEALSEEVKALMLSAAATGRVKNEFDAFRAAEDIIIFGKRSISSQEHGTALYQLESFALGRIMGGATNTAPGAGNLANIPASLYSELKAYDIIVPEGQMSNTSVAPAYQNASFSGGSGGNNKERGKMVLSDPWADFYAALAIASQLMRGGDPRLLATIRRANILPSCTYNPSTLLGCIPLHTKSKLWSHLALCVRFATGEVEGTDGIKRQFVADLLKNFDQFASARERFSVEEKGFALINMSNALMVCGLEDHLVKLVDQYKLSNGERTKVCEAAARSGAMQVLNHMTRWPASLDQPSVLAASYACPDQAVAAWLHSVRKIRLSFHDACRNGWYEAVRDFCRSDEYRDNKEGGLAALNGRQEVVANILYSRGSTKYRGWLAGEVRARQLPWTTLLVKAGQLNGAWEPKREVSDVALDAVENVASKAQRAKNKLKGLLGFHK